MHVGLKLTLTWPWSDFLLRAATGKNTHPQFLFSYFLNYTCNYFGLHRWSLWSLVSNLWVQKQRDEILRAFMHLWQLFCLYLHVFFVSSCAIKVCARIVVVLWGATNSGLDLVTETRCLGSSSAEQCPLRTGGNTPAVAVVLVEEGSRQWSAWAPSRCRDPFLKFYNDLILMIIHPKIMNIPIKLNAKMTVYRFW